MPGLHGPPSGQSIEIFVAQMARHDGDWNRVSAGILGEIGDQWSWPLLAARGGQDEGGDILVLVDRVENFLADLAFADHPLRRDAGKAIGPCGGPVEGGIRL